jgi:peptide subunit release factor 1 (eRF1)
MLDDLLGRTELKQRIAKLEEEKERLENQLEAEQERRAEAATARQDAEERVNRLEDRIADLEGKLEQAESDDDLTFRYREDAAGERRDDLLARLRSFETAPEGVLTAYVDDADDLPDPVVQRLGDRTPLVRRAAPCLVVADDGGLVATALEPPVPPGPFCEWDDHVAAEPSWFRPQGRYALALVRADVFAVGVYEGTDRVDFSGFESDVKGQHSKGGYSQARFERLRDEQVQEHLDDCTMVLRTLRNDVDRLFLAGDRKAIEALDAEADAVAAVDATGEPEAALGDAFHDFWTTRVYGL